VRTAAPKSSSPRHPHQMLNALPCGRDLSSKPVLIEADLNPDEALALLIGSARYAERLAP
jgi:hypothetical protein